MKDVLRLTALRVFRYRLPLTAPLTLKGHRISEREGLLIRAESEGRLTGWGEAAPLPGFSREDVEDAVQEVRNATSRLIGQTIRLEPGIVLGSVSEALRDVRLSPSVRFGVELALLNLAGAATGSTLAEVLGLTARAVVNVNALVTGDAADEAGEAQALKRAGFRTVKLKVGGRPVEEETGRVRAIRQVLGPDVALRLDANRAWRFAEAEAFARAATGCDVEYVEEPLGDPSELRRLAQTTGLPVALDESLKGIQPEDLVSHDYARAVVLKPTFLGGLARTLAFMRAAEARGLRPTLSAAFESGVALSAIAVLAAACVEDTAAGLDTYRRLGDDVIAPRLNIDGGRLDVAGHLGHRPTIRQDLLREL